MTRIRVFMAVLLLMSVMACGPKGDRSLFESRHNNDNMEIDLWGCKVRIPEGFQEVPMEDQDVRRFRKLDADGLPYASINVGPDTTQLPTADGPFADFIQSVAVFQRGELHIVETKTRIGYPPVAIHLLSISDGEWALGSVSDTYTPSEAFLLQCPDHLQSEAREIWQYTKPETATK